MNCSTDRPDPATRGRDEHGAALLLAVAALTLVSLLGAVLLANARAEIRRTDRLVDRAEAESVIDVAVSAAWGDIVAGASTAFRGSGETTGGPWSFRATPVTPTRWEVVVDSGTGSAAVTGRVTITREALAPYSLLVEDASTGPLRGRVRGRVGITGEASFAGRSLGDVQELIGSDATCTGCDNPVIVDDRRDRDDDHDDDRRDRRDRRDREHDDDDNDNEHDDDRPTRSCPDVDGTITGPLGGDVVYECDDEITLRFTGIVSVDGPVVFVLGPKATLRFDQADLNPGGNPADLSITQPESDDTEVTIVDSSFRGVLSVPDSRLTTFGFRWVGMVVAEELVASSGSELAGDWTPALETFGFDGWRITGWQTERR